MRLLPRRAAGLVAAGVYLFSIPLWVDPLFTWMLTGVGDGMAGIILAATALLLLPLSLISVFTPFAVRLLLKVGGSDPSHGPVGGIHWHMNVANKIEYYPADEARHAHHC